MDSIGLLDFFCLTLFWSEQWEQGELLKLCEIFFRVFKFLSICSPPSTFFSCGRRRTLLLTCWHLILLDICFCLKRMIIFFCFAPNPLVSGTCYTTYIYIYIYQVRLLVVRYGTVRVRCIYNIYIIRYVGNNTRSKSRIHSAPSIHSLPVSCVFQAQLTAASQCTAAAARSKQQQLQQWSREEV